jgi:hypothetical protein
MVEVRQVTLDCLLDDVIVNCKKLGVFDYTDLKDYTRIKLTKELQNAFRETLTNRYIEL